MKFSKLFLVLLLTGSVAQPVQAMQLVKNIVNIPVTFAKEFDEVVRGDNSEQEQQLTNKLMLTIAVTGALAAASLVFGSQLNPMAAKIIGYPILTVAIGSALLLGALKGNKTQTNISKSLNATGEKLIFRS